MTTQEWLDDWASDPKRWNFDSTLCLSCVMPPELLRMPEPFWCDWEWVG